MGLTYATESFVLSVLGWAWLTVQERWAWSLLCSAIAYAFLCTSALNLAVAFFAGRSKSACQAYFASVLAFALFAAGCILDTFPGYIVQFPGFNGPGNSTGCCSNSNMPRTNQLLFFTDSPWYIVQAGIFAGYLVIQVLLAGAGLGGYDAPDGGLQQKWQWGLAFASLLCARLYLVFNGGAVTLCPDSSLYILLFDQPLGSAGTGLLVFMGCLWAIILCEFPRWDKIGWIVVRAVALVLEIVFFAFMAKQLIYAGILSHSLLASFCLCIAGAILGVINTITMKIPELQQHPETIPITRPTDSGPAFIPERRPPTVPENFEPSAPPQIVPGSAGRMGVRYYVPVHVQTGREKKGV